MDGEYTPNEITYHKLWSTTMEREEGKGVGFEEKLSENYEIECMY